MGFIETFFFGKSKIASLNGIPKKLIRVIELIKKEKFKTAKKKIKSALLLIEKKRQADSQKIAQYFIISLENILSLTDKLITDIQVHKISTESFKEGLFEEFKIAVFFFAKGDYIKAKAMAANNVKRIKIDLTRLNSDPDNFTENLKFSTIYSKLEVLFLILNDMADAGLEKKTGDAK